MCDWDGGGQSASVESKVREGLVMEQNGVIYLNNDSFLCDKAISLLVSLRSSSG